MERVGVDCSVWRGDLHKSLLLLDEHRTRPKDDNISKTNEMKIKTPSYLVITVGATSCFLFRPKGRLIVRWARVSWTGKTSDSEIF